MVAGSNFYLLSAGVLPALVLVQWIGERIEVTAPSDKVMERFNRVGRHAGILGTVTNLLEAPLYVLAEVVCLRALETGRAPIGTWIVWLALGEAAFWVLSGRIVSPDHARAFAEWSMRKLDSPGFEWLDPKRRAEEVSDAPTTVRSMDETIRDGGGNTWSVEVHGDRVDLVLVRPVDDREEPIRVYLTLSADETRALADAFARAASEASG